MKGFTKAPNPLVRATTLDVADKGLLIIIRSFGDPDGSNCRPSLIGLAQQCQRKERWVMERIAALEESGWLTVARMAGKRSLYQVSNVEPLRKNSTTTPAEKQHPTKKERPRRKNRSPLKPVKERLMKGILSPHREP